MQGHVNIELLCLRFIKFVMSQIRRYKYLSPVMLVKLIQHTGTCNLVMILAIPLITLPLLIKLNYTLTRSRNIIH